MSKVKAYKLEDHVNDWVKEQFNLLKLKKQQDYHTESDVPEYLKDALKGRAKTASKTNFGKPDFSFTKYSVPVVIENKLGLKNLLILQKMALNLTKNPFKVLRLMAHFTTPPA